jgi:hypothetical protein
VDHLAIRISRVASNGFVGRRFWNSFADPFQFLKAIGQGLGGRGWRCFKRPYKSHASGKIREGHDKILAGLLQDDGNELAHRDRLLGRTARETQAIARGDNQLNLMKSYMISAMRTIGRRIFALHAASGQRLIEIAALRRRDCRKISR